MAKDNSSCILAINSARPMESIPRGDNIEDRVIGPCSTPEEISAT
ncbi:hypothetical protein C900_00578 [Fulvivirga imtechensis AK7]|uniref:Uncharacterized protein n=1 Tax=Fulvivirga imtechensis AK7 TaxID=1237149 RepID=L8JHK2_9BACT|nr:hypothetical protein C900_00578 [Fulvivirga imtechensis AK7]